MTRRRVRRLIAGGLVLWTTAALWLVPAAIRWVHGGGGPGVLRRLMPGVANVPVTAYLRMWADLIRPASFLFVTASIAAWFILPLLAGRRERAAAAPAASPSQSLAPATIVLVSVWGGLAFGLLEAHYIAWKTLVLYEVIPEFRYVSVASLWMAPVVDVVVMTIVGVLMWGVFRALRRPFTLRSLVAATTFVSLASLIMVTGRVALAAVLVFALGVALRLGPVADRHHAAFLTAVRHALPRMAAGLLAIALLTSAIPPLIERRARAALPAPATGAPNIIVLVMDTERASNMSAYGYERPTTPTLARFARAGVLFERAMAPSSWTLPSHAAMFTSRTPAELGTSFLDRLDDTYPTMAEVLRDHGYMTAGFVGNLVFCTALFGLDRGFVHYEAQPISVAMVLESAYLVRAALQVLDRASTDRSHVRKDASRITRDFLAWQDAQTDGRPYLAFLNYFDAHGPYRSPPDYRTRFAAGDTAPLAFHGKDAAAYQPAELRRLVAAYDGAIAYVDAQVGVLLDALERRGELQHTIVVLTADHGEEFGEHGRIGHGFGMTLPLLHVPLLVLDPSVAGGRRVSGAVTLTDLPATLMEIAGVRDHPFLGRSWSRYWGGAATTDTTGTPVFSEYGGQRSVLVGDWHFVRDGGEFLYNVAADPTEQHDLLASADPALLARLRAALRSFTTDRAAGGEPPR